METVPSRDPLELVAIFRVADYWVRYMLVPLE